MQRIVFALLLVVMMIIVATSVFFFVSGMPNGGQASLPGTLASSNGPTPADTVATPTMPATPTPTMQPTSTPSPSPIPSPTPTPSPTPSPTPTPVASGLAAYEVDAGTGKVMFDLNSHAHLPIASTTKIMTAIIAIENGNLDQLVTIQKSELNEVPAGMSLAYLQAGDQISLRDLLYALLLPSGSDAAVVIAHQIAGTTPAFVAMMNAKASALQLTDTHFASPHGFYSPNHYSSAADLTKLAIYAMGNPTFAQVVLAQHHVLAATIHNHLYPTWDTTNDMLATYMGMDGVKTGSSPEAGYCMVFSATRNGHHLVGAELHAQPYMLFPDVKRLLDLGFANTH
ncbi:MAG TPA: serine hydrolase [Ktedonosporobacter sp.]|nr:serine hydrolase [Ktedonosporobacter sp.]